MKLDLLKNAPAGTFLGDIGGNFLFFMLLYVIMLIKLTIGFSASHSVFFNIYSVVIGVYILSRFLLSYFHKTIPFDETYEPTVTFVVPAKNEEDNIAETIRCFDRAHYP